MSNHHQAEPPTTVEKTRRNHPRDVAIIQNPLLSDLNFGYHERAPTNSLANANNDESGIQDEITSAQNTEDFGTTAEEQLEAPSSSRPTRKRKQKTKEIPPNETDESILSMINLGLLPFMLGQGAMSNQNRLVRNEAILARHVSRVLQSQTSLESTNAERVQGVYRMLGDQKTEIKGLRESVNIIGNRQEMEEEARRHAGAYLSDPEIVELREEQRKTRIILNQLNDDVTRFSSSTKRMIDDLAEAVKKLSTQNPVESNHSGIGRWSSRSAHSSEILSRPPVSSSSPFSNKESTSSSLTTSIMNRTLPPITTLDLKRPRSDSIISSGHSLSGRMSTRPTFEHVAANQSAGHVRDQNANFPPVNLNSNTIPTSVNVPSRQVLYGPIRQLGNLSPVLVGPASNVIAQDTNLHGVDLNAIINVTLRNAGLNSSMVQSVRRVAHGRPDHVIVSFWSGEDAHKFIDLVGMGLDGFPDRRAVLMGSGHTGNFASGNMDINYGI